MRRGAVERLGSILLQYKLISEKALQEALEIQRRDRGRLGEILVRLGHLSERELTWSLANQLNLPCVSSIETRPGRVDVKAVKVLPRKLAYRHHVLPVIWNDDELTIVTDDPLNQEGLEEIEKATGLRLNVATGPTSEILQALDALYSSAGSKGDGEDGLADGEQDREGHPLEMWLTRARLAGYRRMIVDPGGRRGRPVVRFRGYPGETSELELDDYRAIMGALRDSSGHKNVLGPTMGPFRFGSFRGTVAFAHTRGGLAAAVNLFLPGEDVDWPRAWLPALRDGLVGPGLWLVAVASDYLWEPFTYFVQEAFEDHGRVIAGGLVQDGPMFPRTPESYTQDTIGALFALDPEIILFPSSARKALIEHLRAGLPNATVLLQVAARDPVRALQVLRGYGVSGAEMAEMVRGVLVLHGAPHRAASDERRGGAEEASGLRKASRGVVPLLGWYLFDRGVEEFLVQHAPSREILPLLKPGGIPSPEEQAEGLVARGALSSTEAKRLLRKLGPYTESRGHPGEAVDIPEVSDGEY